MHKTVKNLLAIQNNIKVNFEKLNIDKNKIWFIDHEVEKIKDVKFVNDDRHLFGGFIDNKLVITMGCFFWKSMPFTLIDTFIIDKSLGLKTARNAITATKSAMLEFCEQQKRVAHFYIGPLRESRIMISNKGLWTEVLNKMHYIKSEIGIIPANTTTDFKLIEMLAGNVTYPVDMLVFMIVKDLNNVPDNWDNIINLGQQ